MQALEKVCRDVDERQREQEEGESAGLAGGDVARIGCRDGEEPRARGDDGGEGDEGPGEEEMIDGMGDGEIVAAERPLAQVDERGGEEEGGGHAAGQAQPQRGEEQAEFERHEGKAGEVDPDASGPLADEREERVGEEGRVEQEGELDAQECHRVAEAGEAPDDGDGGEDDQEFIGLEDHERAQRVVKLEAGGEAGAHEEVAAEDHQQGAEDVEAVGLDEPAGRTHERRLGGDGRQSGCEFVRGGDHGVSLQRVR